MSAADLEHDSLAHALAWLTRHHGRERSVASLLAEMPLAELPKAETPLAEMSHPASRVVDAARTGAADGHATGLSDRPDAAAAGQVRLRPEQALRALREADFEAGLVERRLTDIHPLLLPAVLLLQEGQACLLLARHGDGAEAVGEIVLPGPVPRAMRLPLTELAARYTGQALVATPLWHAKNASSSNDEGGSEPAAHWLWGNMRRFAPYYRSAMLAALLSNALMLVTGIVTAVVYDKVIPHQAMVTLWALAGVGALALVFDLIARQLRTHLIDLAGRKADLLVGSTLYRQSLAVRMESRPESSGAYAHVMGQVETVREFFSSATLSAVTDLPFIFIFVAMTFVIGGPLGWVLVFTIPVLLGTALAIQGRLRRAMSANMQQHADLHGVMVESVDGLEDLKAAGAQGRFLHQFESTSAAAAESALRSRRISSFAGNLSGISQQAVTLMLLVWGVHLIQAKTITGGMLIGAVMFSNRAIAPLNALVNLTMRYQGARAAMRSLDRVMAQPVDRDPSRGYLPAPPISGALSMHDVGFAYPGHDGQPGPRVLQGVGLGLQPGERVAILGRIGSGKSTILRLLAGLYQPSSGRIQADGLDLRQIDPADFRARVGFVAQAPRLFTGTLRDNVLLGRAAADPARLQQVARLTGLDRMVDAHPMGWDLPVGEAGSLLSGGQRQLVALSRCLVTQPQVILMDEPTSSMDAQSEAAFLRALGAASSTCTLVMVTHRPAVLALVQRVIVVDNGRVVLDGPKAQVMAALAAPAVTPATAAAPAPAQAPAGAIAEATA